jgi:hypothetical protein
MRVAIAIAAETLSASAMTVSPLAVSRRPASVRKDGSSSTTSTDRLMHSHHRPLAGGSG